MQVLLCKSSYVCFMFDCSITDCVTRRTTPPWINPFNVSKHIILEEIGGESGFNYATVAEQGPS